MGATKRPDVDWVAAQAMYMTDTLPLAEIGKRFGVSAVAIHKRAKKEGWVKDLSRRVATGVREAVVNAALTKGSSRASVNQKEATQRAVVQAAIEEGKEVVLRHQGLGKRIATNSGRMQAIIERQLSKLEEDPEGDVDEKAFSFLTKSHDHIASATLKAVQIERQARGLDDMPADPNAPPSISITYYRSDLVLTKVEGPKNG